MRHCGRCTSVYAERCQPDWPSGEGLEFGVLCSCDCHLAHEDEHEEGRVMDERGMRSTTTPHPFPRTKPRIADLEKNGLCALKTDDPTEMDQRTFASLLSLARAAKNACGQVIARSDHEYRTRLELQQSLDAFDWSDKE